MCPFCPAHGGRPAHKDWRAPACPALPVLSSSICLCQCTLLLHLSEHAHALLSLSLLSGIFPPLLRLSLSLSLSLQDSTPPTDTILDNYSLLILLVFAAPGAVFFILDGHLLVHHSLHFLGGKMLQVPIPREAAWTKARQSLRGGSDPLPHAPAKALGAQARGQLK